MALRPPGAMDGQWSSLMTDSECGWWPAMTDRSHPPAHPRLAVSKLNDRRVSSMGARGTPWGGPAATACLTGSDTWRPGAIIPSDMAVQVRHPSSQRSPVGLESLRPYPDLRSVLKAGEPDTPLSCKNAPLAPTRSASVNSCVPTCQMAFRASRASRAPRPPGKRETQPDEQPRPAPAL